MKVRVSLRFGKRLNFSINLQYYPSLFYRTEVNHLWKCIFHRHFLPFYPPPPHQTIEELKRLLDPTVQHRPMSVVKAIEDEIAEFQVGVIFTVFYYYYYYYYFFFFFFCLMQNNRFCNPYPPQIDSLFSPPPPRYRSRSFRPCEHPGCATVTGPKSARPSMSLSGRRRTQLGQLWVFGGYCTEFQCLPNNEAWHHYPSNNTPSNSFITGSYFFFIFFGFFWFWYTSHGYRRLLISMHTYKLSKASPGRQDKKTGF